MTHNPSSQISERFLVTILIAILWLSVLLTCCSCSSGRGVIDPQLATLVHHDTIYLSNVQYDSIYIDRSALVQKVQGAQEVSLDDARGNRMVRVDTLIKELTKYEYKYRLLHDTCYVHRVDSIPVIKTVEVSKTERHVPWYAKTLSWIGAISLIIVIVTVINKIRL